MQVGRNETCPCGSGAKYKNCCANKSRGLSHGMIALLAAIVAVAALGVIPSLVGNRNSRRTTEPEVQAPAAAAPAPAAPVQPATTTASAESPVTAALSTAAPGAIDAATVRPPSVPGSPQPGPAPAGQVWSVEHGHWHDIATGAAPGVVQAPAPRTPVTLQTQPPPGPAPAGKVWSAEHGHYH